MNKMTCEMCGGTDLMKQDGVFVCQSCGCKYSVEEAKKLMIEGTVDVKGTVKVDNSDFVEKCLSNARRALDKQDWEEVIKYYNMVEQNAPNNIEAIFFSPFGKAVDALMDDDYYKKEKKFAILVKSMGVINDYFEETSEDKESTIKRIDNAIKDMYGYQFVYNTEASSLLNKVGSKGWHSSLMDSVRYAFVVELKQIQGVHNDLPYINEIINKYEEGKKKEGCYVATAVYGSYDCPQVWVLRRYRDFILARTWYGKAFIKSYYATSPTVVKYFGKNKFFVSVFKPMLDRLVMRLRLKGVLDTPYKDRDW